MRAAATGDAGPMLNPAGMSLIRSYAIEGSYQYLRPGSGHVGHASIVDSTSGSNVAGGLYYTYATASPEGAASPSRHEGGLALSYPLGALVSVGATVKYLRTRFDQPSPATDTVSSGITVDAGLNVRPTPAVSLAVVGYGLRDLERIEAPLAMGFGAAFTPRPELLVAVDGVLDFTTYDDTRGRAVSVFGGAEYAFAGRFAARAGGGYDGFRERAHGSLGVSVLAEFGAIDVAARQELSGSEKATYIGVAGRLFVQTP